MKYYYLKLKDSFFDKDEIKIIENLESGYEYITIILKMYLRSLKMEGYLAVRQGIPYDLKMLASVLGHKQDTVKTAVEVFIKLGLIEILESGEIYMLDIALYVGKSSTEAERVKKHRSKKNQTELEKALSDFEVMRNKIKKPLTARAKTRLLNKLDNLTGDESVKVKILDQSIYYGWQDVYPLKEGADGKSIERFARNTGSGTGFGKYENL